MTQSTDIGQEIMLRLARLKSMRNYLLLKFDEEDFHGVQDAASDIRDIEGEIKGLEVANGIVKKYFQEKNPDTRAEDPRLLAADAEGPGLKPGDPRRPISSRKTTCCDESSAEARVSSLGRAGVAPVEEAGSEVAIAAFSMLFGAICGAAAAWSYFG